ncbi:MAG: ABC transporter ATP-binding protein [Stappiaceae bacterium]
MMELSNLTKSYDGKPVIDRVSLTVGNDEYLTLLGPSGSGKSTLLKLIAGLEWPETGTVSLNGEDIGTRPPHLRGLGFVQQKYALFPHLNIFENVAFGLRNRQVDPVRNEGDISRRTNDMLHLVGLDDLGDRMVGQISGGQKQRVSLARTLVAEPKICLLDEPLGALDANLRERMTIELRRIRAALGVTFLHATGNETEAMAMGDRMVVLDEGRALQTGAPDTIYNLPLSVRVARSVNAYNILPGKTRDKTFLLADMALPLPEGVVGAHHYAMRYGAIDIGAVNDPIDKDCGTLAVKFITSEFVGSRMVYFFRRPDEGIMEVEHHLSRSDPLDFKRDAACRLTWPLADVLAYDANGELIRSEPMGVAA